MTEIGSQEILQTVVMNEEVEKIGHEWKRLQKLVAYTIVEFPG